LGWGPENFSTVFDKHFDPRHYVPGKNTETWFDRAHSIYFDYLAETGVLGLAGYLSIFAVMLWGFVKLLRHGGRSAAEVALLIAIPVGYLAQGIAIFDVLPMYINLFVVFAFAYFILYGIEAPGSARKAKHRGEVPKINTSVG